MKRVDGQRDRLLTIAHGVIDRHIAWHETRRAEIYSAAWNDSPPLDELAIADRHPALAWFVHMPASERRWYAEPSRLHALMSEFPDVEETEWVTLLRRPLSIAS